MPPTTIIPTYNNHRTIAAVIDGVREYVDDIIVVDDGSTDGTGEILAARDDIDLITIERNAGKGRALQLGLARARERGFTHALTIDADGQHLASDIPVFLDAMERSPSTLFIGNRVEPMAGHAGQPARSKFGARFGTFWYKFHTGLQIDDTQCGFRLYPLEKIADLSCRTSGYEFEIEVLIKAAWARAPVEQLPVHLYYQPAEERVSHFRPLRDFWRISMVNSRAALTRIFMPWKFVDAPGKTVGEKIRHLVVAELRAHHAPRRAAAAIALGVFVGLTPFHGAHVGIIVFLSFLLRLNRPLSFLGVSISSAPLLPLWIALSYWTGALVLPNGVVRTMGEWATGIGLKTLGDLCNPPPGMNDAFIGITQWFFGSLLVAVAGAVLVFAITYPMFYSWNRMRTRQAAERSNG